jgi:hypothetical protein
MTTTSDDPMPCYVALSTPDGWQLLLEYGGRYLRWVLRGPVGSGGQAWPDTDVSAASLEREGGSLAKPALQREGVEVGHYRHLRNCDGDPLEASLDSGADCLDQGHFELEFDGELLAGRWQLTRSGQTRREQETWTFRPMTELGSTDE